MTQRIMIYVILIWVLFLGADWANEFFDDMIVSPGLGEYRGHVFGMLRLCGFVIIVIYILISLLDIQYFKRVDLLFIGVFWIVLHLLFVVIYSHYRKRMPWGMLLGDYDIREGRLKGFVLLTELIAPCLLGTWRQSIRRMHRNERRKSSSGSSNGQSGQHENAEFPTA
ncbi:hypothetical protein ACFL6S_06070 [Candidatus Poribacteria bacterium]